MRNTLTPETIKLIQEEWEKLSNFYPNGVNPTPIYVGGRGRFNKSSRTTISSQRSATTITVIFYPPLQQKQTKKVYEEFQPKNTPGVMSTRKREITLRDEDSETSTLYKVEYQSTADIVTIEQIPVERPEISVKMHLRWIDCSVVFDVINEICPYSL